MPFFIFSIFFFIFGLCVGSFLNVLIDRLPKGEQVITGRSYCDHCHKKLSFFDLIPLLSFLFLGGKCRYCHKKISLYYPLVEFLTGASFLGIYFFLLSNNLFTIYYLLFTIVITSCLIVIFFADLKYGIIPDEMIVSGSLFTALFLIFQSKSQLIDKSINQQIIEHILIGFGASLFFLLLLIITRGRGMGMGDVKLAFLMGFFLGWPKVIVAIYLAFLTGALVGVILILIGKKKFGEAIPFGPFLVIGTLIATFWGEKIFNWWLKII